MLKKIRGSALQFTVIISVVIFIILGTFLLLAFTYSKLNDRTSNVIRNIYKAQDIIVKYSNNRLDTNQKEEKIEKTYWGGFEKVVSKSGEGIDSFLRAALLGTEISRELPRLYLADQNIPLVLAGRTKIAGDIFVPGKFVKPGSVAGEYFQGTKLVHGQVFKSQKDLPELEGGWLNYIDSIFSKKSIVQANIKEENVQNSFLQNELILVDNSGVLDYNLKGNVVLFSSKPILIKRSASIDQILIVAPKIKTESGFVGSFHAITNIFESDTDCHFEYPSSVTTLKEDSENFNSIVIKAGTRFEGNLISLNPSNISNNSEGILINEDSEVLGFIYCEGDIEFYGKIRGSIYANKVLTEKKGSKYLNHLFSCTITDENLPITIAGPVLRDSEKTIASWLY